MTITRGGPTQGGGAVGGSAPTDPEALLVALVLVPQSYPRNRFFELFRNPEVRRVRRRAARIRGLIEELSAEAGEVEVSQWGPVFEVRYPMPGVAAVRRARLDRLEVTLVAAVMRRSGLNASVVGRLATVVGEPAVAELAPVLARLLDR